MNFFFLLPSLWAICFGFEDKRVTRRIRKLGGDAAEKEAKHSWRAEVGFAKDRSVKPKSRRLKALKEAIKRRVQQHLHSMIERSYGMMMDSSAQRHDRLHDAVRESGTPSES